MGKAAINPLVITRHNALITVTSDLAHIACTFITLVTTETGADIWRQQAIPTPVTILNYPPVTEKWTPVVILNLDI